MSVIRHKIWRDLWDNRGRTLQVVLIIGMGAFAIGMIIGTRNTLTAGMEEIWVQSSPAMVSLYAYPGVDDETLAALGRIEGMEGVEAYQQTAIEWRLSPDDEWSPGSLIAREDYENQRYAKVELIEGDWPRRKGFAISQGCQEVYGIQPKGQLYVRIDDREVVVDTVGEVYDPNIQPPNFGGVAQFYATGERFGDLVGWDSYNRILARAEVWDEPRVMAMADEMQDKLERIDVESGGIMPPNGSRVSDPHKHFFQDVMDGLFFILGIMAVVALVLGLSLVYNTITAIISRQINQIGIMKAVGANTRTILTLYLTNVLAYGLLALLFAVPLGLAGAWALGGFLLHSFNVEDSGFGVSSWAILAQVVIALLSPLVACLVPVISGARTTVREALSTYGLSGNLTLLARLMARIRRLPRLVSLTINNTFRHTQRVILTLLTLVLSGLIFMTVMSARDASFYTFNDFVASVLRFNVILELRNPERIDRVASLTLGHPEVKRVEMWSLEDATIRPAGQPESNDDPTAMWMGLPLPTEIYGPQMRAGRWLRPEDGYAVVLNEKLAQDLGVGVGDTVTIQHVVYGDTDWVVVGLLFDPVFTNSAHVSRQALLQEMRSVDKASTVWIQTVDGDPASEAAVAGQLRDLYRDHRLKLSAGSIFGHDTASEVIGMVLAQFAVIVTMLATMAVVIGIVGSIALNGVLSINVLERRREIGVMRAIGASSGAITGLFVGEGVLLGWMSWLMALPLSIPAGWLMVRGVGAAVGLNLVYKYTPLGALSWLAVITVLSMVASWFPARGATRVSVRESLAYE